MSKAIQILDMFFLLILIDLNDFWSKLTLILGIKIASKIGLAAQGASKKLLEAS